MIEPIILSRIEANSANTLFNNSLTNEPATFILILGDTDQSIKALEKTNSLINSSDHFYNGVRVLHAPTIDFVLDTLKTLMVSPRIEAINWDMISSYVFLSISNEFNTIGNIVLASKYGRRSTYYIEKSIMLALAYDQDLN